MRDERWKLRKENYLYIVGHNCGIKYSEYNTRTKTLRVSHPSIKAKISSPDGGHYREINFDKTST